MSIKMEIADEGRVKHLKIALGPKQLSMLRIFDDFLKVCSNKYHKLETTMLVSERDKLIVLFLQNLF